MDTVRFVKVRDVRSPERAHNTDAGIDFFIPYDTTWETVTLPPGGSILIPSGLKLKLPRGKALLLVNKSGVSTKKKLIVGACLVDEGYRGEMHIHLINSGNKEQYVRSGDKIVQGVLIPYPDVTLQEISEEIYDTFYSNTERGSGGFGSTG